MAKKNVTQVGMLRTYLPVHGELRWAGDMPKTSCEAINDLLSKAIEARADATTKAMIAVEAAYGKRLHKRTREKLVSILVEIHHDLGGISWKCGADAVKAEKSFKVTGAKHSDRNAAISDAIADIQRAEGISVRDAANLLAETGQFVGRDGEPLSGEGLLSAKRRHDKPKPK